MSKKYIFLILCFSFSCFFIQGVVAQTNENSITSIITTLPDFKGTIVNKIGGKLFFAQLSPPLNGRKLEFQTIYFTDGKNIIYKKFNIDVNSSSFIQASGEIFAQSEKFILAVMVGLDQTTKQYVSKGYVFNYFGNIVLKLTEKELQRKSTFLNDEQNQVLLVDPDDGELKIFNSKGEIVRQRYFSDQNPDHSPEMFKQVGDCGVIGGFCEPRENRYNEGYIAVTRNQGCGQRGERQRLFKNELTLLDLAGEPLFQNRAPNSITGVPLKVFEDLKVTVVAAGEDSEAITAGQYYGLDFQGKKLWEYHGGLMIDRGDLMVGGIKKGFLKLVKHEIHPISEGMNLKLGAPIPIGEMVKDVYTGQVINLKTGEVSSPD